MPHGITIALLAVLVLAVIFDYINGFHDTANAIATSVATRALHPGAAVLMAAAFNFIGAFAGTAVAKTIGVGLVDEKTTTTAVVMAALIGAIAWNLITWRSGLPSSSSHALIGSLLGATIVAAGVGALKVDGIVSKVLFPLVTSPLLGFALALALGLMGAFYWTFFRTARKPLAGMGAGGSRCFPPATWPSPTARTTRRRRWGSSPSRCLPPGSSRLPTSRPG